VELLAAALDHLDEGISLYQLAKLGEYKEQLAAAKAVLAQVAPQLAPLPVIVVSVPTAVVMPVTTAVIPAAQPGVASAAEPDDALCNVCPTATAQLSRQKGGGVVVVPTALPSPVIVATVVITSVPVPTLVVGLPITVPSGTAIAPALVSGGLGIPFEEWVAHHGQPDALVDQLYLFDEADRTYSLLVIDGRISTIYVAWKPEFRPDLATAQAVALELIPLDSSLVQASNLAADRFTGQYLSRQLAAAFPNAPYAPLPAGTFTVTDQLAEDGLVFQMVVATGAGEP
jgi:hypothetical protein